MDDLWICLVVSTPLKTMKVNWDDEIPNIWEHKKCSKPPTRIGISKKQVGKLRFDQP